MRRFEDGHLVAIMWLAMIAAFGVLVVAMAGCGPSTMPGQSAATTVVWNEIYGQEGPAPVTVWRSDCTGPAGQPGVMMPRSGPDADEGQCVASYYEPDVGTAGTATVAWDGRFSKTGFAHELANAVLCRTRCEPVQDTPSLASVTAANRALDRIGL